VITGEVIGVWHRGGAAAGRPGRASGVVPLPADPGGRRSWADDPPARAAGPRAGRGRASGPVRAGRAGVTAHDRPLDPGLALGWVRGAGPAGPPGHPAHRRGCAGAGCRAEAGTAGADRRADRPDLACPVRLVPLGAHAAAAFRAAGAEHPPRWPPAAGVWPVRGRSADRAVDRGRAARPARRGPQGLPVLLHRRSQQGGDGRAVGLLRGHDPAGRRAAPGAGRPRRPRRHLR
jgi:hypothetical protein